MVALGFYIMMWYPIPLRSEFFAYQESDDQASSRPLQAFRSWLQPPSERMLQYIDQVTKRQRIWKYIPGVQSVYLANSITFNAIQDESNIDFFVVTGAKRLRTTKLLVKSIFFFIRLRERKTSRAMRFGADFFVTEEAQDFSRILLSPSDPYLVYRLAHLVPIYHADFVFFDTIYEENKRLQYYLPNFGFRQTIFLGIDVLIGVTWWKRVTERVMYSVVGDIRELVVKYFSLLSFRRVKWRKPFLAIHILIWSGIYKSYDDKRKRYALQRELLKKTEKTSEK
jgi:hypothetical protein